MTNATKILSVRKTGDAVLFKTEKGGLFVDSFVAGVAMIDPPCGAYIKDIAKIVEGCFQPDSNFHTKLKECFDTEDDLTAIQIKFSGLIITATMENDAEWIAKEYERLFDEDVKEYRKKQEEYQKTEEYKLKRAKELKAAAHRKKVQEKVKEIAQKTEMEFKNQEAKAKWEELIRINEGDPVFEFAICWAKYMQHLINGGAELSQIADETSSVVGIALSGFTYGYAVSLLCQYWKYGEELRRWHNKEWGAPEDAKGVVNPAVFSVSAG